MLLDSNVVAGVGDMRKLDMNSVCRIYLNKDANTHDSNGIKFMKGNMDRCVGYTE